MYTQPRIVLALLSLRFRSVGALSAGGCVPRKKSKKAGGAEESDEPEEEFISFHDHPTASSSSRRDRPTEILRREAAR